MEIQCCSTCKYGYYENGECVCVTDDDYMPHDVDAKNKCDDYVSRNRETNIHKITIELRRELLSNRELYDAFVASVESALKEMPPRIDRWCASKRIADRIIGREE